MAWAIMTIYISKFAQMNPQQLPKTSKFYSKCKKCDIEKTSGGGYHPLGSPKVKRRYNKLTMKYKCTHSAPNVANENTLSEIKSGCTNFDITTVQSN